MERDAVNKGTLCMIVVPYRLGHVAFQYSAPCSRQEELLLAFRCTGRIDRRGWFERRGNVVNFSTDTGLFPPFPCHPKSLDRLPPSVLWQIAKQYSLLCHSCDSKCLDRKFARKPSDGAGDTQDHCRQRCSSSEMRRIAMKYSASGSAST